MNVATTHLLEARIKYSFISLDYKKERYIVHNVIRQSELWQFPRESFEKNCR